MRAARRYLHRCDLLRQRLPADARDRQALEDGTRLLLWRAYLALLQGLCTAYRINPVPEADPASELTWLRALADFNPQMGELLHIQQVREDPNHWLYQLRHWWQQYWADTAADTARSAEPQLIDTDTAGDWVEEARTGLAEWAEDLARYSQTN